MGCFSPLQAWRSRDINEGGKRSLVFNKKQGLEGSELEVPCGQCLGCRLEKSRQWAVRCLHEASLHENNCFITLTYDDEHLPTDWSLDKKHFQDFMKRLRERVVVYQDGKPINPIRYYQCGEYGEQNGRPHYHACLFGYDPQDKVLLNTNRGVRLYTSELLADVWGKGFVTVGDVTFESAAYVARYVMKKITGDAAEEHYKYVDADTGEIYTVIPEYTTMSRRPGIGADWLKRYHTDTYPSDSIIVRGQEVKPPKYYDNLFDKIDPDKLEQVKENRKEAIRILPSDEKTLRRLRVKERVKKAQINFLKRTI